MPRYCVEEYCEQSYTDRLFEAGFFVGVLRGDVVVYSLLESAVYIRNIEGTPVFNPEISGKIKRSG